LSYQPTTFTVVPITLVNPASTMHELGSVTISVETIGSSVYVKYPLREPSLAFLSAELISATEASFANSTVKSVAQPVGTGTLRAYPSSLPFNSGRTKEIAFAAPVEVGIIERAAARDLRKSLCGKSKIT